MYKTLQLFFAAFTISFVGTLPLGTLNVSISQLAYKGEWRGALLFAIGAVLVEVIIVRVALVAVGRLEKLRRFHLLLAWSSVLVLAILAIIILLAAIEKRSFESGLPFTGSNPFVAGLLLSLLNPLHLPFWMGWTAILRNKALLGYSHLEYNLYIVAIGLGTLLAFGVYAFAGASLIRAISEQQYLVNWAVGLSLLGVAIWQGAKLLRKHESAR
jgi:threonine/homoserine/homoserine lactone efflux protein